jgi:hypothetical protein
VRFVRIVSDVFLDYANDLNCGHSARQAGHPVLSGDTQQLIVDGEAIFETFNPTKTGGIVVDSDRASVLFTIYTRTGFQEVATRPADIRLLSGALLAGATRRTNQADSKQRKNRQQTHGTST